VFGCPESPEEEEKISVTPGATVAPAIDGRAATHPPPLTKKNAPGATSSLVCGILGMFTWGLVLPGLVLGLVAIGNANKAKKLVQQQPNAYTGDGLATAGLVIGIIDLVLVSLVVLGCMAGAAN